MNMCNLMLITWLCISIFSLCECAIAFTVNRKGLSSTNASSLWFYLGKVRSTNSLLVDHVKKSSFEETFTFLHMVMEVCKASSTARGFLYDELAFLCETMPLDGTVMEW